MNPLVYLMIRAVLWLTGVSIPLFPTLQAAPTLPSTSAMTTLGMINQAGLFRDLFFVVVPAAALPLATTLDFLCTNFTKVSATLGGIAIIALIANIIVLTSGFVGFLLIPPVHRALSTDLFSLYSWIIGVGLFISLATELSISYLGHRFHRRHRTPE